MIDYLELLLEQEAERNEAALELPGPLAVPARREADPLDGVQPGRSGGAPGTAVDGGAALAAAAAEAARGAVPAGEKDWLAARGAYGGAEWAEALDRMFQRDARRYDGGFSLF